MEHRAVPSVVGLPATTAEAVLQAAGFRMSPAAPMGTQMHVRSQAPPPGVPMAVGSVVSVIFGS
ncbi:MAG: PASTA domain-containing protein [Actinomycetota bacterium]|nr:PASTA domain-containing protein [Actinomycetota bacterium]